jgi:hypothetical protein
MSILFSWCIGIDSEEWRTRLLQVVQASRVPATILPQANELQISPLHPLQHYLIETADDVMKTFQIGTQLARRWWENGWGSPTIGLLVSAQAWEAVGTGSGLPVSSTNRSLFEVVVYKEFVDDPTLDAGFAFLSRFRRKRIRVYDLYHYSPSNHYPYQSLEGRWAHAHGLDFEIWKPYSTVDESVIVLEGHDPGSLITSAYHFIWQEGLWRKPTGLVALAPVAWHAELRRAQVEDRPLFLDVCAPDELRAEGVARVQRWRAQLQSALEAFYAEWAAKLPSLE